MIDAAPNPLSILTFISAPAVLTNASCVLLFGTGNRYGRAVDRVHELADMVRGGKTEEATERELRVRQLEAGEQRALLIVRALTCFYTAVAGFVASTLLSLIGALLLTRAGGSIAEWCFGVALAAGVIGVAAMIGGALMLARETTFSFRGLQDERRYLANTISAFHTKV